MLLVGWREETSTKLSKRISGFFSELVEESCPGVPDIILEIRSEAFWHELRIGGITFQSKKMLLDQFNFFVKSWDELLDLKNDMTDLGSYLASARYLIPFSTLS